MDCRFCCCERAVVRVPTAFGTADLCHDCAALYGQRRAKWPPPNETSGPARPPVSDVHFTPLIKRTKR